jgi:hypothetical protein
MYRARTFQAVNWVNFDGKPSLEFIRLAEQASV